MLADIVDIGDEYFNVTDTTDTKSYDFICKSKKQFEKAFGPILKQYPNGLRLIRTYLPHGQEQLKDITEADKKTLKSIITMRMESLKSSEQHSNRRVINIQFDRYYKNLEKLLKKIDAATGSEPITPVPAVQKRIRDKFPKERVYYLLMEIAYKLLHPDDIHAHSDEWMKILDAADKMSLGDFVKGMYDPAKHTTLVDVDRVERATVLDSSVFSPPDASIELKRRLEAIMTLLQTKKYLNKFTSNAIGPDVTPTTLDILSKLVQKSMVGGGEIPGESLKQMMSPFYTFFKEQYGILPSILTTEKDGPTLVTLSRLLFICQKTIQRGPGIYQVVNLDPELLSFIKQQVGAIQAVDDDKKEEFVEAAKIVPLLSIRSLMNKFGTSGHYTDPDHRLVVRFFVPENSTDSIYLVCNESSATEPPTDAFKIDYTQVNVSKDRCDISSITVDKEILDKIKSLEPESYNHGMLALVIFLLSEQLLS